MKKSGVLQPIMPLDLPVKVRPWEWWNLGVGMVEPRGQTECAQ